MSPRDYLSGYFSDVEFEKRINQNSETNKPEDSLGDSFASVLLHDFLSFFLLPHFFDLFFPYLSLAIY